jgi:signal transduction histidine kinase
VLFHGLGRFTGKRSSRTPDYLVMVVFISVFAYFTFSKPDVGIRIILISSIIAWFFLRSAWLLFIQVDARLKPITRGTGMVCLLYVGAQCYRLVITFLIPAPADYMRAGLLDTSVQLLNLLLSIALGFSLILMSNRRSLQVIRETEDLLVASRVEMEVGKRIQHDLELSHQRLEAVLDSMDAMVYVADIQSFEILFLNDFGKRLFGVPAPEKKCYEVLQDGMQGPCPFCTNERLVDSEGKASGIIHWEHQNTVTGRWFDCRDQAIHWTDGRLVRMEIATDITERKGYEMALLDSQQTLRSFTNRLMTIQEEERSRLARDLHDDFTQRLAVFALELSSLSASVKTADEAFKDKLEHLNEQIATFSKDIHDVSRQLHPSIIDDLGIARALQSECRNFTNRTGIEVEYTNHAFDLPIPKDISIVLFRVVQEVLRNIQKHARVQKAELALLGEEGYVCLIVQDYGAGFDPGAARPDHGLGLTSINERVLSVGGTLSLESALNKGTRIQIRVPLEGVSDE